MICNKCGSEYPLGSKFCNTCGNKIEELNVVLDTDENVNINDKKVIQTSTKVNKDAKQSNGCLPIVGVFIFLFIGTLLFVLFISGNLVKAPSNVKLDVWVVAEDAVKENLKAPSTADFPGGYENFVTDNGDGTYTVKSYVDAENSFGAKIRNNFSVIVQKDGGSYSYKDLYLTSN